MFLLNNFFWYDFFPIFEQNYIQVDLRQCKTIFILKK